MSIAKDDVEKIAQLARLELTPEETESFTRQLGAILSYVEKLNELETATVEPMSHCTPTGEDPDYTRRDDVVRPGLGQALAVENAPDSEGGYFKVPKVIGG
jgi:aspartyl-tRNA(Asn)/glutamyl-tRNA(Gln) amidotransferase subunit C